MLMNAILAPLIERYPVLLEQVKVWSMYMYVSPKDNNQIHITIMYVSTFPSSPPQLPNKVTH